ncbi:MAG TPA: trigger factor [Thermoanaerobaculia bacterium]|nr:trigger factor [Thermoanaerobaculia bacterium]
MVLSVEDAGPCRKEVTIEVPAPAVEAETERVAADYRRKVRLPGFRPGKVPTKVVLQRYRKEIEGEVLERLVPRYWRQAEAEASLDPLMAPSVDSYEMVQGEPLKFVASVEVRPEIEVSEDREFELPSSEVLVGEAEVDEVLEQLRLEAAPWKPVDRESSRGDRVELRVREIADDGAERTEEPEWSELEVELGNESVWEELRLAATGLKAGQRNHFTRQEAPPARNDEPGEVEAAPPPRHFELEVVSVEAKELPELDDELATALAGGGVENVEALRADLEKRLFARKSAARRREREEKLTAQLIERHPITLPEGVVAQEAENLVRDYAENLARAKVDLERIDWRAMMESARPEARRRVHSRLVLDAIAAADEVEVSEQELEGAIQSIARAQGHPPLAVRRSLDERGGLNPLRQQLRREKALRALLGETPPDFAGEHDHQHVHDHQHDHQHDHDHDHDHHDHDHDHRHD